MVMRATVYHDDDRIIGWIISYFSLSLSSHSLSLLLVQEIHEWFENRKDKVRYQSSLSLFVLFLFSFPLSLYLSIFRSKLYKRIRYYLGENRFVEFYHPGTPLVLCLSCAFTFSI